MSISYIYTFIAGLVFTIIVETTVLFMLLRFVVKNRELSAINIISAGFFASFSTIPYVWFVFPYILGSKTPSNIILYSESFAFITEAIFYRLFLKTNPKISLALSLVCNAASYFLGQMLIPPTLDLLVKLTA